MNRAKNDNIVKDDATLVARRARQNTAHFRDFRCCALKDASRRKLPPGCLISARLVL